MSYFDGQFEHHQMYSTLGRSEIALTWAVPVDIIQLLTHVDAFESAQPDVRTLRLCNRFGKGKHAHVAKLPKEIIDMIERQLLVQYLNNPCTQRAVDWPSRYRCFECSCRPVAHIKSDEHKLLNQAIAMVHDQNPDLDNASSPSELTDRDDLIDKKFLEICRRERINLTTRKWFGIQGWTTAMSDQREGELPRYRTLIRKHFGLELFVMHENMDIETGQYLQRTDHRIPKGRIPNQATICYLKLPSTQAVTRTMIDYGCGDSGYAAGTSGKSMLVEPESLGLTASQKKQFSVCMSSLSLQVSVHPSQLRKGFVLAPSQIKSLEISSQGLSHNAHRDKTTAETDGEDEEVQAYFKELETSGWPKLVLLVKERFDIDGVPDSES